MAIADRLKALRESHNLTQAEFGEIAGVSDKAVSSWEKGNAEPRMGAIQKIADHFGLKKSDIIEDNEYYLNPESARLAQQVFERPELKILFDAVRDVPPEDIRFVIDMVERMKK